MIGADNNCEWNKQEVENYLGNGFYLTVYHNQKTFEQDEFGDERIQEQSQLSKVFTVANQPAWSEGYIKRNSLIDETAFLQLGQ